MNRVRLLLLAGAAGLLGACAILPITLDLLGHLGSRKSGSYSREVPRGTVTFDGVTLPQEGPWSLDFSGQNVPVSFKSVRLIYEVALATSGPGLSGTVTVQAYLAPAGVADVVQERYRLGSSQVLDLGAGSFELEGSADLTAEQVAAVNDKKVQVVLVFGGTATAAEGGTLRLDYEVKKLLLSFTVI
ncbi:hypothetical protein [Calidithermus chliarophilus]|uniref:hypothetical protein n=1 Tax=Calidithermus chliarophilus TaxID=52023 RepID=UPI000488E9ED|nr:hypothetical protein [Calidithermus chliarophilus]